MLRRKITQLAAAIVATPIAAGKKISNDALSFSENSLVTNKSTWPLLDAFPLLAKQLNPIKLCASPTAVNQLPNIADNAWVKRDDLTSPLYGGNKTRKLELLIPEMMSVGAKHVVTLGGSGTNHGVATAMACQHCGLECSIITFKQEHTQYVEKNQALMKHFGANLIAYGSVLRAALSFYLNLRRLDSDYYFLPAGGSTPIGTLAYVNAALELKKQVADGEMPEPMEIYVPAGSTSTLAGLTLGCAIAGLKTNVIGIQVMDSHVGPMPVCTAGASDKLIAGALAVIRQQYPEFNVEIPQTVMNTDWFEPGYGVLTSSASKAIAVAKESGLILEQTYSGKAFAAFTQRLQETSEPILYWATYSSSPLPAELNV